MKYYEDNLKIKFQAMLGREEKLRSKLEMILLELPEGKLYVRDRGGRKFYSRYLNGKETYITRQPELITGLKEREQVQRQLTDVVYQSGLLHQCRSMVIACGGDYESNLAEAWIGEPYEKNPLNPEHLRYMTNSEELVRSKSERTIADALYRYKQPFRYECGVPFENYMLWPDFTIRKYGGEIVLWEHFGLMEKPDYYFRAMEKIRKYRQLGFVLHRNLICTWEEDLLDPAGIEEIIERFLL